MPVLGKGQPDVVFNQKHLFRVVTSRLTGVLFHFAFSYARILCYGRAFSNLSQRIPKCKNNELSKNMPALPQTQ